MNLAELTDRELATRVADALEAGMRLWYDTKTGPRVSPNGEDWLESFFHELRQQWQKTTVSYHRGQIHWRTERP